MKKLIDFVKSNSHMFLIYSILTMCIVITVDSFNKRFNNMQNVTGLKQKVDAIKLENKQLLKQNLQASNYIDSLKSVLVAKQNEITWYALKDQAVVAKLYEINHHLINLNIKYEKANERVANFNSDSIIRYFSNYR